MLGSIRRFGKASVSQCEIDEPPWIGLVAKRKVRCCASAPERTAGSERSVAVTPEPRFDRIFAPSAWVIRTAGIVIVLSVPPSPAGGLSVVLSATSTAIAPAVWTFFALTTKVQVPRSTSAIFPATSEALLNGEQASIVEVPSALEGSLAATTWPVRAGVVRAGPKEAVPTG